MTTRRAVTVSINNPALDAAMTNAIRAAGKGSRSTIPKTRADFERLVASAESDLKPARRGRPRAGLRGPVTRTRSIRAPESVWKRLDALAKARGITTNQVAVLAMSSLVGGS